METLTYSAALDNLPERIDRACQEHEPFIIDEKVIVMSLQDYRSLEETAHLLSNPVNARRLLQSIEDLNTGKGIQKDLPEWK